LTAPLSLRTFCVPFDSMNATRPCAKARATSASNDLGES
jgi:hypothetical protein